ncbi:MAG: hypothetical protein HFH53_11535 [Hespellia sp.]|nr:hypothetical protein [Hespellia sp.]
MGELDTLDTKEREKLKEKSQDVDAVIEEQLQGGTTQEEAVAPIQAEETGTLQESAALVDENAKIQEETPPDKVHEPSDKVHEPPAKVHESLSETLDEVKKETLKLVKTTGDLKSTQTGNEPENAEDKYFDELPVDWKEASDDASVISDIQELKAKIGALREGNLYQAVIVSRRLKNGKENPMASGAISRAVHSSAWNTVGDLNAATTGFTGLLSTFEKDSTAQTFFQGISLVTNFITIISSARAMYLKWEKMKFRNKATWTENFFLGVGMIGDLALMFAKAVAMAKTIASWAGKDLPILKKISNWMFLATGTSQAIALMNTSRALTKTCQGIRALGKKKDELWTPVKGVICEVLGEPSGASTKEEEAKGEAAPSLGADSWNEDMRIEKAEAALEALHEKKDEGSERKKDLLVQYLGLSKRISKQKHDGVELASTAVNLVVGIFSSIVTGGRFVTSYGTAAAKADKKGDWSTANKIMGYTGTAAGLTANSAAILTSSVKIGSRVTNRADARSTSVKGRLLEKLETLERDEYGLKYLEDSLSTFYAEGKEDTEHPQEKDMVKKDAQKVEGLYQSTQGMFTAMGVPLDKLVRGKDQEAFEKILVSGLV